MPFNSALQKKILASIKHYRKSIMYHFARSAKKKEMGSNSINSEAFLKSALFDFTHPQKWVSLNLHSSILKWVALLLRSDFRSALMSGAQKSGALELVV